MRQQPTATTTRSCAGALSSSLSPNCSAALHLTVYLINLHNGIATSTAAQGLAIIVMAVVAAFAGPALILGLKKKALGFALFLVLALAVLAFVAIGLAGQ